jgi:hypothetical protein
MDAFLTSDPNAAWPPLVPEISTEDPVLGGKAGPVNVPHQTLVDRTEWLKTNAATNADLAAHAAATAPHAAASAATANRLVLRDSSGRAKVAEPAAAADIATKGYIDTALVNFQGGASSADLTRHIDATAVHGAVPAPTANRLMARDAAGRAQVADPAAAADISTKKYVDDTAAAIELMPGPQGKAGAAGAKGTGFYAWRSATALTSINQISGVGIGDYIVNTNQISGKILGKTAQPGDVVVVTSSSAGDLYGSLKGPKGFSVWPWNSDAALIDLEEQLPNANLGDMVLNTGSAARTILGVSAPIGAMVKIEWSNDYIGVIVGNLRGATGAKGTDGVNGAKGDTGPQGTRGNDIWAVPTSSTAITLANMATTINPTAKAGDYVMVGRIDYNGAHAIAERVIFGATAKLGDIVKIPASGSASLSGNIKGADGTSSYQQGYLRAWAPSGNIFALASDGLLRVRYDDTVNNQAGQPEAYPTYVKLATETALQRVAITAIDRIDDPPRLRLTFGDGHTMEVGL